ncbi:MAG: FAD-dependent oxidoreductase [Thermoleophilia bacterium]
MAGADLNGERADEVDVVVCGSGLAGCAAALAAAGAGATVVVVEREPPGSAGGNSRVAQGEIAWPVDADALVAYQRALNGEAVVPDDVLRAYAQEAVAQRAWVERLAADAGLELVRYPRGAEFPELPGAACVAEAVKAPGLWGAFRDAVARAGIPVLHRHRAVGLLRQEDAAVAGVACETPAGPVVLGARGGVVLCVGGHENAGEETARRLRVPGVRFLGSPANTGDGLRLLEQVGARLWHDACAVEPGGIWPSLPVPGLAAAFLRDPGFPGRSWLELRAGSLERFGDETADLAFTHYRVRGADGRWADSVWRTVERALLVLDEAALRAGPLGLQVEMGWSRLVDGHRWSPDNADEVERGWIVRAGSLAELAARLGEDPARLESAVARFDDAARARSDAEHGRDPTRMAPLAGPPYFAVVEAPAIVATTGGGERDARARVLAADGAPIPGLYEAGELGSIFGGLYQNGSFLAECVAFGRIAGREAAGRAARLATA